MPLSFEQHRERLAIAAELQLLIDRMDEVNELVAAAHAAHAHSILLREPTETSTGLVALH